MKKENGFALISVYMVLTVLLLLTGALVARAVAEVHQAQRSQASLQAFYLAEAGIDQTLTQLKVNFNASGPFAGTLNSGTYSVTVANQGTGKLLTASGSSTLLLASPVVRRVEAIVRNRIPPNFYDNVIWASQELDFRGTTYQVVGDVRHGDTSPTTNTGGVNGTVTYDAATNPLPRLNFQKLYDIAQAQGNVYDEARLANGHGVFPTSFWYSPPTDPNDPTTGIPNVNYVTTDLILRGNIGTIGGFFVVVGDVLTDPDTTEETIINGVGHIEGAIYTTDDFRVNGGGNRLNVNGGVWAGDEARLNGAVTLTYNWDYMHAIQALDINADIQLVSWREIS